MRESFAGHRPVFLVSGLHAGGGVVLIGLVLFDLGSVGIEVVKQQVVVLVLGGDDRLDGLSVAITHVIQIFRDLRE